MCGFDPANCLCLEPLPCEKRNDCPTFDENVEIFRKALGSNGERTVSCERAETGHSGELRYFLFVGDIHRDELRWFDRSGRLIAQRNVTDYDHYCDGKTFGSWKGRIPVADTTERDQLICGRAWATLLPPLENVRDMLATGLLLTPSHPPK